MSTPAMSAMTGWMATYIGASLRTQCYADALAA